MIKFIDELLCGAVDFIDGTIDTVDNFVYENITKPIDEVYYDTIGWTNSELVHAKIKTCNYLEEVFQKNDKVKSNDIKVSIDKNSLEKEENNKQNDDYVIW